MLTGVKVPVIGFAAETKTICWKHVDLYTGSRLDRYGAGSRQTYFLQPGRHNAGAEGVDANIQLGHKMPGRHNRYLYQAGIQ